NTEREFNIPRYPNLVYSDWKGWSDWLNSSLTDKAENIQFLNENFIGAYNMVDPQLATVIVPMNNNKKENVKIDYSQYLSFEDAKEIIQKKNFQNKQEWYHFTKSKDFPTNIPHNPHEIYIKDGWINMDDWLGINIDTAQYLEIEEAKKIVHRLHLHSRDDWYSFTKVNKLPKNIPEKPHLVYKNKDWIDYQDWVGYDDDTYYKLKSHYLKFEVAKKYIHSLKFKSIFEWFAYIYGLADYPEVPNNIPRFPKKIYHDKGWNGLNDWLGIK
ncbi:MAG: hypothetical protein L0Y61_08545, partial [Epsilonproteobacteria bacterium]|nr:hypothetical protein [Campylobacterota bacterium]